MNTKEVRFIHELEYLIAENIGSDRENHEDFGVLPEYAHRKKDVHKEAVYKLSQDIAELMEENGVSGDETVSLEAWSDNNDLDTEEASNLRYKRDDQKTVIEYRENGKYRTLTTISESRDSKGWEVVRKLAQGEELESILDDMFENHSGRAKWRKDLSQSIGREVPEEYREDFGELYRERFGEDPAEAGAD